MTKTVLLAAFAILVALIVTHRERLYIRDPLATVYRSDVKQDGVEVYQNYSNDVLIEKNDDPGAFRILVQDWNEIPGTPMHLTCLRWIVCLTDDDHVATIPIVPPGKRKYDPTVTMTNRGVSFVGIDGARIRVTLR